jgi:hypothetical protein
METRNLYVVRYATGWLKGRQRYNRDITPHFKMARLWTRPKDAAKTRDIFESEQRYNAEYGKGEVIKLTLNCTDVPWLVCNITKG